MDLSGIKNLVFDLGGVIIDLHVDRTVKGFSELAGVDPRELESTYGREDFFELYEKGLISDQEFRDAVSTYLGRKLNLHEIDHAWNAMLGRIPARRIEKLVELGSGYRTFLLSNTNQIHLLAYTSILKEETGMESLDSVFEKTYYSHQLNMRKPDLEIFEHVLDDAGIIASETLFLDDTYHNILAAEQLRMNTFHVSYPDRWIEELFNEQAE